MLRGSLSVGVDGLRVPGSGARIQGEAQDRRLRPPRRTRKNMTQFQTQTTPGFRLKETTDGALYVDYRSVDELRRLMTPNGKIYSRKRTGLSAQNQAKVAQAIKRARFMALLPYTSATM